MYTRPRLSFLTGAAAADDDDDDDDDPDPAPPTFEDGEVDDGERDGGGEGEDGKEDREDGAIPSLVNHTDCLRERATSSFSVLFTGSFQTLSFLLGGAALTMMAAAGGGAFERGGYCL